MQRRSYQYSMSTQSTYSAASTPSSLISTMARRRKDSDEIDVFEAARYFSGGTDGNNVKAIRSVVGAHDGGKREERYAWRPLRKSLDIPIGTMISQTPPNFEKHIINEKKSSKQPSSPGGRLASFLNSLFSQVTSKVKQKYSSSSREDDCKEKHGERRRRRRSSTSQYSPSSRASTSRMVYKVINDDKKPLEKGVMEKKEVLKISREDDGGESDSSSDLFELKNYELSDHAVSTTDLPVYGATNMKAIKRGCHC